MKGPRHAARSRGPRERSRCRPRAGEARERHLEAARLDPDVDESEAAEQYDQEQGRKHGITSHGYGEGDDAGDERVEHYERTETDGTERERVYEQDESGDVVRDEERERPR